MLQEHLEYLGMDSDEFKRITIPIKLINTSLITNKTSLEYLTQTLEQNCDTNSTPLDICLVTTPLRWADTCFNILITDDKPDITVAVLHDTLMMKLFPPKSSIIDEKLLQMPIFEVEFLLSDVPKNVSANDVLKSLTKTHNTFEGELLCELLNKAVRPQRNKIEKPLTEETMSEALELIERENVDVENILINTKAFSIIRHLTPADETYRGINVVKYSPEGRMNKNRVYFMGEKDILGRCVKTAPAIQILNETDDSYTLSYIYRMGITILNRNIISIVEH